MVRVNGPSVDADLRIVAAKLRTLLSGVVVQLAQRLQRIEEEFFVITSMRLDVVGDRRELGAAFLQTHDAERLGAKLIASADAPVFRIIPRLDVVAHQSGRRLCEISG